MLFLFLQIEKIEIFILYEEIEYNWSNFIYYRYTYKGELEMLS